ncbi:MAG: phosphopantothenoylcysteine decarboxylase [Treponema sp.]|nr:phosphopantothenoylcysteine decarboxylase [Treponema sp.]
MDNSSNAKTIVLGITGSIAAYKAADIANSLTKDGYSVHAVMTKAAVEFITPLTLQSLTKNNVYTDVFDSFDAHSIAHIELAQMASIVLIAPASADFIAKAAAGIADDMLGSILLATKAPILFAPAMNTAMYEHPFTQRNIRTLQDNGAVFIEPRESLLACGDLGRGALAEQSTIIAKIKHVLGE